jgi:hypothetical protein
MAPSISGLVLHVFVSCALVIGCVLFDPRTAVSFAYKSSIVRSRASPAGHADRLVHCTPPSSSSRLISQATPSSSISLLPPLGLRLYFLGALTLSLRSEQPIR